MEKDNTIIKSKAKVFGETITVAELFSSLISEKFLEDGFVFLHTKETDAVLTAIYTCKLCDSLHLVSGNFLSLNNPEKEKEFDVNYFSNANEVYVNRIHVDKQLAISKKELIETIRDLAPGMKVTIEDISDNTPYTLAEIRRCSDPECPSVHLTAFYNKNSFHKN